MSETTNLKLFKHDNPATNKNKFDIEKALNQNWDKVDTEVGENKNDISNLQKENEELKEENKHLKEDLNGLPSGTVSGENIDITDSAEMRCELNISGNSVQEVSKQNKNFIVIDNGSITESGLSLTFKNGVGKLNGVLSNNASFKINLRKPIKLNAGTYTMSNGANYLYPLMSLIDINNEVITTMTAENKGIKTFILDRDATCSSMSFWITTSTYQNILEIKPQLEGGSNHTGWIEGTVNMPSLEYPSEVESCGDNVNLLNISSNNETVIRILDDEATISYDNEVVKVTRNVINHSNAQTGIFYAFKTEKGKEYTVTPVFSSVGTANVRVFKDNTNTTVLSENITSGDSYTFIAEQGQYWLRFWISNNFVGDSILCAKVVEGREATSYSPYGQGCINEVICNRNELCSGWEQGAINIDTGIDVGANNAIRTSDFIRVMPNVEYYISRTIATLYNTYCFYDINKNFIGTQNAEGMFTSSLNTKNMQANNYEQVFTINNVQVAYMKIFDVSNNLNTKYLLQRNTIVDKDYISSEFQTHTIPTQKPFRAIGNTRDTFVKKNNEWYERHYIERYEFTGNEDFVTATSGNTQLFRTTKFSSLLNLNDTNVTVLSNIAKGCANIDWTANATTNTVFGGSNGLIQFICPDINSLDDFKNLLKEKYEVGTPVYIDYVRAMPLDIESTEEQNKILNKIENEAKTYKNITHVYSIDKVSSNAEITYKKDLETLFSNALTKEV